MRRLAIILPVLGLVLGLGSAASAESFVRMVSGPAGGSWYPLGAKLAEVMGKEVKGIATSNAPGGGVGNVRDISSGNAELGWSYGHTAYNGFMGRGKFKKAQENVRHFATLYPAALQTAVPKDSPIKTYADLKGRNISPGPKHFSGNAAAELLLAQYGLTYDGIKDSGGTLHHVSYKDSVALMKDGHIDAFIALTSVPQASFIDLNFSPGIRFLPVEKTVMDKFMKDNPGYIRTMIPKSAYEGLTEDVPTIGAVTVLVVGKDVPDDVVYNMAKVMWENHAEFAKVKKVWNEVKLENALLGAAIPVHPGAKRYYDEMGVKAN